MNDTVLYTAAAGVAVVTLNRPAQRNAVNAQVADGVRAAIDRAQDDPDVRVVILTGAGPVFCAGMDLKAFLAGDTDDILYGEYGFAGFVARTRTKPVIAAVEGAALAGGFEIMLACDMAIAATDAVFGLPEPKLGLIAGAGGAMRLAQRIPRVRANEILLTGRIIDAATASELGLLNRVVPQGQALDSARALAAEIAGNAPHATQEGLALSQMAEVAREADQWAANDAAVARIGETRDAKEGVSAFLEKRSPIWTGR